MITDSMFPDDSFLPELDHSHFMKLALNQAVSAFELDEVPVGAVIVNAQQRIIGSACNEKIKLCDPTAHAEILAITQAATAMGDWRLEGCTLYVTLEPCPMCAGAILQARIPTVVFGASDPKAGAVCSVYQMLTDARLNHQAHAIGGIMEADCSDILTEFFRKKRAAGKK